MKPNLILIGFMGTGKTTVGRLLARRWEWTFIDLDADIEKVTGMTVTQIFARYGERRFRSEETMAVQRAAERQRQVISTGGGVVLKEKNVEILQATGKLVCLTASPEVILERVGKRGNRPLLQDLATAVEIQKLMERREPYYCCADLNIDTSRQTPEEVVDCIDRWWNGGGKLHGCSPAGSGSQEL